MRRAAVQVGDVRDADDAVVAHAGSLLRRARSADLGSRRSSSASSRSSGTVELARERGAHRQEVARLGDVVHAQHARAVREAVRDRGERAGQPLARRAAR